MPPKGPKNAVFVLGDPDLWPSNSSERGTKDIFCECGANVFSCSHDISYTNKTKGWTCFAKHKPHTGQRMARKISLFCPWWPWPVTLTLKLVRARNQTIFHVNLAQICSAVPEIFHTQTKTRAKDVLPNINRTQAAEITPVTEWPRLLLTDVICSECILFHHRWEWWECTVHFCPWWPWPLTFKFARVRTKHVFTANLVQILQRSGDIFHTQTKSHRHRQKVPKTES